jgi:DNA-binding transcriptional regulator YbjK
MAAEPQRRGSGPRGAARRIALLEAAVRVIGRGGIAAVDHRAVAAEAGVALGSTTYYFASKEDMVAQALAHVAATEVERLDDAAQRIVVNRAVASSTALVDELLDLWTGDRVVLMAQYELYIESGRRDDLRASAAAWERACRNLLEHVLEQLAAPDPRLAARLLCAGLDGLVLEHVATGSTRAELRSLARELIERLAR